MGSDLSKGPLKIVVSNFPAAGHLAPVMTICKELVKRGHHIHIISAPTRFSEKSLEEMSKLPNVTSETVITVMMDNSTAETEHTDNLYQLVADLTRNSSFLAILPNMFKVHVRHGKAHRDHVRRILNEQKPDVFLADLAELSGFLGADQARHDDGLGFEVVGVSFMAPVLPYDTTLGPDKVSDGLLSRFGVWFREFMMKNDIGSLIADGIWESHQVCDLGGGNTGPDPEGKSGLCASDMPTFRELELRYPIISTYYPGYDHAQPKPPNWLVAGPLLEEVADDCYLQIGSDLLGWLDKAGQAYPRGVVAISFGSTGIITPEEIKGMFAALAQMGDTGFVWKTSRYNRVALESDPTIKAPSNLRLQNWVDPDLRCLFQHPSVRVVVNHCGMSAPQEAISQHRPIVCMPLFGDQAENALLMLQNGVGLATEIPPTQEAIHKAIDGVLKDYKRFAARAVQLDRVRRAHPGVKGAASFVETVAAVGSDAIIQKPYRVGASRLGVRPTKVAEYGLDSMAVLMALGFVNGIIAMKCLSCCCGRKKAPAPAAAGKKAKRS